MATTAPSVRSVSPIDLPEIRSLIARYLSNKDLIRCILVNRDWHEFFLSPIWEDVKLSSRKNADIRQPSLILVRNRRHLVRSVQFVNEIDQEMASVVFPILRSLRFVRMEWDFPGQYLETREKQRVDISSFMNSHLSLTSLVYIGDNVSLIPWDTIVNMNSLKEMRLLDCAGLLGPSSSFWETCAVRLEKLVLESVSLTNLSQLDHLVVFPKLKCLSLFDRRYRSDGGMFEVALRCPNLEELQLDFHHSIQEFIHHAVTGGGWPKLHSFTNKTHLKATDVELAILLRSMSLQCIRWAIENASFGQAAFEALCERFPTLQEVDMSGCSALTSEMVQEILESCPRLTSYRGGRIKATGIGAGRPWACKHLRELDVFIDCEESPCDHSEVGAAAKEVDMIQRRVFEQLALLRHIETVDIAYGGYRYRPPYRPRYGLDLRLCKGLDLLGSWTRLTTFFFAETAQMMGQEDVKWMLSHWKRLEKIDGNMNHHDTAFNQELIDLVKKHGVTIGKYV